MNYARIQRQANKLIKRHGKPATLIRLIQSGPPYDPVTEEVEYAVRLVETGNTLENRGKTLVETGDRLGMLSTQGETPEFSDKIVIDGERYSFVDLQRIAPGTAVLAFTFVARK